MEILILKESEIDAGMSGGILQCLHNSFSNGRNVFPDGRHWRGNVPSYSAVMFDGETVCANVTVMDRMIRVGNEEFRVAGVGNVSVLPGCRGKGLSEQVLDTAMDEAEKMGFDFGLLFTSAPVKKVYGRAGWVEITGQKFVYSDEGEEIEMPEEKIKMFYPLRIKDFPLGRVDLQGINW